MAGTAGVLDTGGSFDLRVAFTVAVVVTDEVDRRFIFELEATGCFAAAAPTVDVESRLVLFDAVGARPPLVATINRINQRVVENMS